MRRWEIALAALGGAALVGGAATGALPLDLAETFGFITGALAVLLATRQHVWNWPVGIANSAFYVAVFLGARLYADMALQVVYIALGLLGWYWWMRGGAGRTELRASHASPRLLLALAGATALATAGMTVFLRSVGDAAPFLDALTTALSLAAQFLLTRKAIENWYVWIAADVLYIGLYLDRELYLTATLYAVFLCLCLAGLRRWRGSLAPAPADARPAPAPA